jgi:hypothetical protein
MCFSSSWQYKSKHKFGKLLFYAMLITCKCTPLYKKLDCNAKSKPPYLITTLTSFLFTIAHDCPGHSLHVDHCLPFLTSLVIVVNNLPCCFDLDLGGPSFTPLVLATTRNSPIHDPHVDCCLLSFPFRLQLVITLLIVVILILVVQVLHLLCL